MQRRGFAGSEGSDGSGKPENAIRVNFHFSRQGSETDLFKDLRDGLVVGCDHRAVVVFEVLVNDGTTFSHRQPRTSLSH